VSEVQLKTTNAEIKQMRQIQFHKLIKVTAYVQIHAESTVSNSFTVMQCVSVAYSDEAVSSRTPSLMILH